jgi:putative aminopeptidase FrvX
MAKSVSRNKSTLSDTSLGFFRNYINTPSPVGFEFTGQRLWMDYIRPHVDEVFTDPYGTLLAWSMLPIRSRW